MGRSRAPTHCQRCNKEQHEAKGFCRSCYQQDYGRTNRAKLTAYRKELENSDLEIKEHFKRLKRDSAFKVKYGISHNVYDDMIKAQTGMCLICKRTSIEDGRFLSVDHCHVTGKIRGLLCCDCNIGLGKFRDSIELLEKAKRYLNEYNN